MMVRRLASSVALLLAAVASTACADRTQPAQATASRSVQPPWQAAANPFVVPGWTSGDQVSWQQQMSKRAQNQNEYLRVN